MAKYIIILSALLSGCAMAPRDDWTPAHKKMEIAFQVANVADAYTTTNIRHHPNREELHPLTRAVLGPNPDPQETVVFFATYGLVHFLISNWLIPEGRTWYQGTTLGLSGASFVVNCNKDLC